MHVIRNNRPEYVVLTEERYRQLVADSEEAYRARFRESLKDVAAGRTKRGSTDDPIWELGLDE